MKKSMKKKKKPFIKPRSTPVGRAHLLVVDDEADFGKMIQKTLVRAGYRVDAAVSATQAIALQRKHSAVLRRAPILGRHGSSRP